MAESAADHARADSGAARRRRRGEHSDTLIRHAGRNLGLTLPIALPPMAVKLFALVTLLVPAIGGTPLPASGLFAAWLNAVPLSSVATGAHPEHRPALRGATESLAEDYCRLIDCASHSCIVRHGQSNSNDD